MSSEQDKSSKDSNFALNSKKFVFKVNPENVYFVESLSYEIKNQIINNLLKDYRLNSAKKKKEQDILRLAKKIIFIFLAVTIGIPLLLTIINVSLDYTQTSFLDMQLKFEKLF